MIKVTLEELKVKVIGRDLEYVLVQKIDMNVHPDEVDSIVRLYDDIVAEQEFVGRLKSEGEWTFISNLTIEGYREALPCSFLFDDIKERITQALMKHERT